MPKIQVSVSLPTLNTTLNIALFVVCLNLDTLVLKMNFKEDNTYLREDKNALLEYF